LFLKFKSDREILFLDPDVDIKQTQKRVAMILSPALYWVRVFDLPLNNEKEAKKLLPSLFEEFLPDGEFSYFGYYEGERYVGFAYEERVIRELLVKKGVDLTKIDSFYFAQSELSVDMLPARVADGWMLKEVDGIILKLPFLEQTELKELDLQMLQLSKRSIKIDHFVAPIAKKRLYMFSLLFVLFGFLYGLEWWRINKEVVDLQKRSSELFSRYNLLPTLTQNRSILKRYEKIDKKQKRVRKVVSILFKVVYLTKGYLQSISIEKQRVSATLALKETKELQNYLKGYKLQIKKLHKNLIRVEVTL